MEQEDEMGLKQTWAPQRAQRSSVPNIITNQTLQHCRTMPQPSTGENNSITSTVQTREQL